MRSIPQTSIALHPATKAALKLLKNHRRETDDEVVTRLIEHFKTEGKNVV